MKTSEILIEARKKIEKPENWTTKVFARDKYGVNVPCREDNAVCFCTLGALRRTCWKDHNFKWPSHHAEVALEMQMEFTIAHFNDNHTHAEVLAAWDRAIAACQALGD